MKNRILLINPPQSCSINARYTNFKLPLGFLYIASKLENNGFIVKILDCPLYYKKRKIIDKETVRIGLFSDDIKKEILKFQPDIVGVSCAYTAYESDSFEVIELVKNTAMEIGRKILIVVGGAHTSANPQYVLRNKNIDIAIIGEGEETMFEIAKNYQKDGNLKKIKGTALVEKGKIIINKPREYIQDLDSLKPAYHLLNMQEYFQHPDNSSATLRAPSVDIITSRGCPANCVFCSIHTVWGRKWRGRSAKNVVDEIEFLMKKYNVKQLRIQDDNLTFDRKRAIDLFDEIIKRKLDIKWDTPNGIAIWALDEEVIKKMNKAGCYRITFGIESGCKKSQQYVRKVLDNKKIEGFIELCHQNRMWVCSTFIIGFPYETKKDVKETEKFILNSRINFPFIYIAQPYLGTDMYNDFKKEGLLKHVKEASNILKSKYDTLHFTNEELNKTRNKIYKQFYTRKMLSYINPFTFYKEFLSKLRTLEDFKYAFKNLYHILND